MRKINKSPEPESLIRYKRETKNNDWNFMHENKHEVYEDLILQCMDDQNYICGYTEVRLNNTCIAII